MKYIFSITFIILSFTLFCQCKSLSKKCIKAVGDGYMHTGQTSASELSAGKKFQFVAIFYEGQNYRISSCSDTLLGDLQLTVRNLNRQLFYDNHGNGSTSYDFKVSNTQKLIISLIAPIKESNNNLSSSEDIIGCVTAIVGVRL